MSILKFSFPPLSINTELARSPVFNFNPYKGEILMINIETILVNGYLLLKDLVLTIFIFEIVRHCKAILCPKY